MQNILNFFNERSAPVYAEQPFLSFFEQGDNEFLVNRSLFSKTLKDATVDRFSPWTGEQVDENGTKMRTKTHLSTESVKLVNQTFVLDIEGDLELRVHSNVHSRCSTLTRKVAYILDHQKQLASDIFYCYNSETILDCSTLVTHSNMRKRRKPSEYLLMKEALKNRTIPEAKKFLSDLGIFVTSQELTSLSRSVPEYVKSRKGRKPPTNASKLLDRYASAQNQNEVLKPVEIVKNGDKISIIQLVAYPIAISHYVKALPYLDDLIEHRNNLKIFESLSSNEAEEEFGKYMFSASASGSLPMFGSSIFIDTTFSLVSGEYITLAVAITDQFRTLSGKNSSFLLALMIHSQKTLEAHEKFSSFLNESLARENLEKRVPSVIHDGESSFRVYSTGIILKDAITLRCDIHRSENIKKLFQRNPEAFSRFKISVFGQKKITTQGIVYKGGLLGVLSRNEFDRKLTRLIHETEVYDAKNWLIQNADSLFNTSSLIKKLEGGWPCQQYLTTNVIEGRNAYLKSFLSCNMAAHLALDQFLKIHEDEMRMRKKAVIGERSTLITDFCYPTFKTMVREQQLNILRDFGLEKNLDSDIFGDFPEWVTSGDGKIHKEIFLKLLSKNVCYQSGVIYFVEADEYITKVESRNGRFICLHPSCKKHRDYTYIVCIHVLTIFRELTHEEKQNFVENMEMRRKNRTFEQVRFRTQHVLDGSKFNNRKGNQYSKNNKPRTFQVLSRLSLDTTQEHDTNDSDGYDDSSMDCSDF